MSIDERDFREACARESLGLYERLAKRIREAQLEREYEAMRLEVDHLIAGLSSIAGTGNPRKYLAHSGRIDTLWAKMDANMDERCPRDAAIRKPAKGKP